MSGGIGSTNGSGNSSTSVTTDGTGTKDEESMVQGTSANTTTQREGTVTSRKGTAVVASGGASGMTESGGGASRGAAASSSSSSSTTATSTKTVRFRRIRAALAKRFRTLTRKTFPFLGHAIDKFDDLPRSIRILLLVGFILWKVIASFVVIRILLSNLSVLLVMDGSPTTVLSGTATSDMDGSSSSAVGAAGAVMDARLTKKNREKVVVVGDGGSGAGADVEKSTSAVTATQRRLGDATVLTGSDEAPLRILYIVTTLAEYNNGMRQTIRGQDRLKEILLPVLVEGVRSMIAPPFEYQVDVYLVLGFKLKPERQEMIVEALPEGVGLEVWDEAMPLWYERGRGQKDPETLKEITRALARQHRFVIRDKIDYYDLFVVFEDDMLITGEHVDHFLTMTDEIQQLYEEAPETLENIVPEVQDGLNQRFFGPMTKTQTSRLVPGFIRVEVLTDDDDGSSIPKVQQEKIAPDLSFAVQGQAKPVTMRTDPSTCCHVPTIMPGGNLPSAPPSDRVYIWETAVLGVVIRQLPPGATGFLDWVLLQPGQKLVGPHEFIGGYWSGRDGAFGDEPKPTPGMPNLIAQQGGWMATREQILEIHSHDCPGGFLPPYDKPLFRADGIASNNVEFWSGGYQFFTGVKAGCNMQRIISLHPDHFSKSLLYHTANNKQRQLRQRLVNVDTFLGQLNAVRKAAERAMERIKTK